MQIQVQTCANLGDEKKPKAWSKYAPDSTAYKKLHKDEIEDKNKSEKKEKKIEKNKNKIKELLKKVNFLEPLTVKTQYLSWLKLRILSY